MYGDFNTSIDAKVSITGIDGQGITFSIMTEFDSKQNVIELHSNGIDGQLRNENIPNGWSGTLHFDRASPELDIMIAAYEQGYFDGKNLAKGSITLKISETKGITEWRYAPVVFNLGDAGRWRKDAKVEQRVQWRASRRMQM